MSCVVKFDRIGRNHTVPDLIVDSDDPDVIAREVHRAARPNLRSRYFDVTVDLEAGAGSIEYGRFGRFTITAREAA